MGLRREGEVLTLGAGTGERGQTGVKGRWGGGGGGEDALLYSFTRHNGRLRKPEEAFRGGSGNGE